MIYQNWTMGIMKGLGGT